jgi:hypothetical protein
MGPGRQVDNGLVGTKKYFVAWLGYTNAHVVNIQITI